MRHFKNTMSVIAAVLITASLLFSPLTILVSQEVPVAQAQSVGDIFEDAGGDFAGCLVGALLDALISLGLSYISGSLTVPTNDVGGQVKETIKDCAGWAIANVALEFIVAEIVEEVNEGIDGNPAYVQSLLRNIERRTNNAIGEFIEGSDLAFLCEPFQRDVRQSLSNYFGDLGGGSFPGRSSCTLDDVIRNTEDFEDYVGGDFAKGGWGAWFSMTQSLRNNPYGAYELARDEAERRALSIAEEQTNEFVAGQGFLSKEICTTPDGATTTPENAEAADARCEIVTPGSVVVSQLNKVLGSGVDRIIQADELNEVLAQLLGDLVTQMFEDDGGLRDLGGFIAEADSMADFEFPESGGQGGITAEFCRQSSQNQGTGDIDLSYSGPFNSFTELGLDGLNGHYVRGTFDFDFQLTNVPPGQGPDTGGEPWRGYFQLRSSGQTHPLWFGGLVVEDGDNIFHTGGFKENAPAGADNWFRSNNSVFDDGGSYHVTVEYVAGEDSTFTLYSAGGDELHRARVPTANSIFPHGGGTTFRVGVPNVPIAGATWENVEIHLEPGAPVCDSGSPEIPAPPTPTPPGPGGPAAQCGPYLNTLQHISGDELLLGISYYGGISENNGDISSDINQFADLGFNNIRVWANWRFDDIENASILRADGSLRSNELDTLRHIIERADANDMTVDVTFSFAHFKREHSGANLSDYREGVKNAANALSAYDNIFFDLNNEGNCQSCSDGRYLSPSEIGSIVDAVRNQDPNRIVTNSTIGSPSAQAADINSYMNNGIHFASPHFERNGQWATGVRGRIETLRGELNNQNTIIHLQEEQRRGWQGAMPSADDFRTSLRNTIQAGAAGWVFHNDAGYNLNGSRRFFNQLDNVEESVIDDFEGIVNSTTCVES